MMAQPSDRQDMALRPVGIWQFIDDYESVSVGFNIARLFTHSLATHTLTVRVVRSICCSCRHARAARLVVGIMTNGESVFHELDAYSTRHPINVALSVVEPLMEMFHIMMVAMIRYLGHDLITDEMWLGTVTYGPSVSMTYMEQYANVLSEFSPAYSMPATPMGDAESIVLHYHWLRIVVPRALHQAAQRFVLLFPGAEHDKEFVAEATLLRAACIGTLGLRGRA